MKGKNINNLLLLIFFPTALRLHTFLLDNSLIPSALNPWRRGSLPSSFRALEVNAHEDIRTHSVVLSSNMAPQRQPDPTLPPPWEALFDPDSGLRYYWNPETNVTQYERPIGMPAAPVLAPPAGYVSRAHAVFLHWVILVFRRQFQGLQRARP